MLDFTETESSEDLRIESDFKDEEPEDPQEIRDKQFRRACTIWFCPTERKIAKELHEMPKHEREKVWADLSGNEKMSQFRKNVFEDPAVITRALADMQAELGKIPEKQAFEQAAKQADSVAYINSPSFRVMFLRSCEYDGKKAANKFVEHMETKKQLFGEEKLNRDIKLSDLSCDDIETVSCGGLQLLSERDNAGRVILVGHFESLKFKNRENLCRALFYCLMTALKDEEVQKLGIVFLWNMINDFNGGHDYAVDMMRIQTISAIPVRPVACYNIFQSKLWNQVIEVQNYMISPKLRARTRSLCGSYSEIMHLLICLGIPYEYILTKKDGEMLLNNPNQWIAERMKIESADWLEYSTARNSTRRKRKRTH